jgi:hypothetical protein
LVSDTHREGDSQERNLIEKKRQAIACRDNFILDPYPEGAKGSCLSFSLWPLRLCVDSKQFWALFNKFSFEDTKK